MSRSRRSVVPPVSFRILLAVLVLFPGGAAATVVVTDAAAFVVAIDNNDAVSVDCSGGFVRVFDDGVPTTYATACAAVTTLSVTATGAFDNTIDLSAVTAAAFTTMAGSLLPVSINAGAGVDNLTGSQLNDSITGGPGNETQQGGAGNDTFIWNPGDGSDTLVGGAGTDTMLFNGAPLNEIFAVTAQGAGFRFTRDVGSIVMDATEVETITLNALGGNDSATVGDLTGVANLTSIGLSMGATDDTVNASTQANATIALSIDGGPGNDNLTGSPNADTITGGAGNDTIVGLAGVDVIDGGDGDDTITGGAGNETQSGGAGNDTFIWNPGDGSDTLVGGAGTDTMLFNGAAANEVFATTAQGAGFRFTRDLGSIVMDATEVETITLNALGGNDSATVGDLTGVANLTSIGLSMGDGDDTVNASAQANAAIALVIDGGAGNDNLTGSPAADTITGGAGNDTIVGLAGVDVIDGGDGDDTITGGSGNETQQGGAGNDTFIWNPGDGSDTLVGGAGTDTMLFNGAAANEVFATTAQGTGFQFTRDLGSIVMDATEVETITLNALGGNDSATVGDLTGVANLTSIGLSMGDGDDTVNASAQANAAIVLTIDGGAGNDNLTGSPAADTITGGAGNDTIVGLAGVDVIDGGDGDDTITGGPGNETQSGGAGNDTFIWNPGDGSDTLVGGAGTDTMLFNGAGANEVFATTVQGTGFQFTRDLGNIIMNATEVEALTLNALGGDDRVTTVPLSGTSQNLVGGTQTTADVLTIDAQGGCVTTSGPGSVTIAGAQPINFSEFEQFTITDQCVVAAQVPTLGPLAMAAFAAFLALAAILVMRLQSSG